MKSRKITGENFRGIRNATYEFSDRTRIKGQNGSGKSTIASMIFFLLTNKDYSLTDNPNVRPNDALDEVVTKVTCEFDFDGKPVEVQKIQKLKRSKAGTVALTNSYMVNAVPKSEKAYREYLEDIGFDFDKFLPCSHPGVLLSGINNKKERTALRNLLFEMASDITDLDVAKDDEDLADVYELLMNYSSEEIAAIQNNTLRVIRENYGKEGEILRAKIEGLDAAKIVVDVKTHQTAIDGLMAKSRSLKQKRDEKIAEIDAINPKASEIMEINFDLNKLESDAVKEFSDKKRDVEKEIMNLGYQISTKQNRLEMLQRSISNDKQLVSDLKHKIKTNSETIAGYQKNTFDESTAICPTCGQKLPASKVSKLKEDHERRIAYLISKGNETVNGQKNELASAIDRLEKHKSEAEEMQKTLNELKVSRSSLESYWLEMGDIPKPNMSENEEYQNLLKKREILQKELDREPEVRAEADRLIQELESVRYDISSHEHELEKEKQNIHIEEQIQKLRVDQANYEQKKANAEKILHQLSVLNMKKNNLLQASVNKNFSLITWKLFIQQKNGEFKDTCIPMIGDKAFGDSMNTGLETLAKIDAMNGIQRYFKLDYPIILDNAEHLDSNSIKNIKTNHQLIMLTVTDDEGLVIEND